jgi:hypothetical protein
LGAVVEGRSLLAGVRGGAQPTAAEDVLCATELRGRIEGPGFGVLAETWFAEGDALAEVAVLPPLAAPSLEPRRRTWNWLRSLIFAADPI